MHWSEVVILVNVDVNVDNTRHVDGLMVRPVDHPRHKGLNSYTHTLYRRLQPFLALVILGVVLAIDDCLAELQRCNQLLLNAVLEPCLSHVISKGVCQTLSVDE